ncbi:MAG TPA: LamG-like jellyroll fold domain-containing protein [Pirellulaceae bacterium]|nr:LamG-like jellyroll fold domain-containing protein [Pirellulaceae bacterium]
MVDDFDPYYTWLGIPPEEQPADLYRLLGVRRYESNGDVLTNAMDQRMHYLRSLQVGKRSALSQKILNEVSSAGVVLLDPQRRAEYDQQLKAKEAKAAPAKGPSASITSAATVVPAKAARPLPMAASLPKAAPLLEPGSAAASSAAPQAGGVVVSSPPTIRGSKHGKKRGLFSSPVVLGGAAFAGVAVLGLIAMMVVRSLQTPPVPDKDRPTIVAGKGQGQATDQVKPQDKNKVKNDSQTKTDNGQPAAVHPPATPTAAAAAWWNDADSRQRLNVLEFDKRASAVIEQTANYVPLLQSATIEGWFKLQLDNPQVMSLFGTRSGGSSGAASKGWMVMARRVAAAGKMADQLALEVWKNNNQFVVYTTPLPDPAAWHHLALVSVAGKELILFVDGRQAMRVAMDGSLTVSGGDLRLGDDANGRGSGLEGQVCGLRISDTARYTRPFTPPSPLALVHDEPTVALLHFTMAVPNAVAGTVRRGVPDWQYGYGHFDEGSKKTAAFTPMMEWNGLQWKPGPSLPPWVGAVMSLDPLGGHTGGQQYAVIRRWTAPQDGNLAIAGTLTHAHETRIGDGIRGRIVSGAAGEVGQWDSRFSAVETAVEKLAVNKGDTVDFLVECKNDNRCDKFAWQVQLALTAEDGKSLGIWDTEQDFHGPNGAGAVYQLARLQGANWQRLDPASAVAMTQLAPIPSTLTSPSPASDGGRVELAQKHGKSLQVVRGSVSYSEATGWTTPQSGSAFTIPEAVPDEYVVEAEVIREEGTGSISFHLPVRGKALSAIIDIYNSRLSGLSDINDWNIQSADNPTVHRGPVLTNGQPAQVRIVVNQQEISLSVDGKKLSSWPYDPAARLVGFQGLRLPDLAKLGVTTGNSKFRIKRVNLISGGTSDSRPSLASGSPIDLIDAGRRTVRGMEGSHQVSGNVLTTGNTKTRVVVDHDLPDEYTLEAEITRLAGDDTLGFGFPVQGRPLCVLLDGWHSDRSGICLVPGQDGSDPGGSTIRKGPLLTNGRPARLRLVVSRQEVVLEIDDQTVASWTNDPAAATQSFQDYEPDGRKLGITSFSVYRIASLKLLPASAESSAPVRPPPTGFAGPTKPPIPDAAAKAKVQAQITAVFGDKLKGAKTPPAKSAVAKEISDLARDTRDLATKYTMLEEAQRLLVEVKEIGPALQTADAMAQDFDVALMPLKVKLLESMAEGNLSAAQRGDLVAEACSLGFEAIDSDQFELAQALANVARTAASRATSADVKAEAKEFTDEFAQRNKRWDAVRRAEKALAASPDDKGANLTLGLYQLFDRNDQAKGLPLLIKGSDAKLAAAAQARQDSVAKGLGGSVEEADAWFDCIAAAPADYKAAVQKRALDAYELALSSVEGIEKAKVTKRRDQLKADLASSSASTAGSKRAPRIRKSDLPESAPGLVGRVFLGGKDAGILVTFNPSTQGMDSQKLRNLLTDAKVPGGRIVLEGVINCPTVMSMRVTHRGTRTGPGQQILVNGRNLSRVGGTFGEYDFEPLQLGPGTHRVQWIIDFDGSTSPTMTIYEDGNSRRVPLTYIRDQNYAARKLTTTRELDLTDSRFGP